MKNSIRKYRERMGLTQGQLAKLAGVSRQTINKYERGHIKYPKQETIADIAYALGCDPSCIMSIPMMR